MDWGFMAFAVASTLSLAAGGLLLLVGYIGTVPAAFSFGLKTGLPVLLLPVIGPVWFALSRGPEFRRPAIQLIVGVALVGTAFRRKTGGRDDRGCQKPLIFICSGRTRCPNTQATPFVL